MKTFERIYSVVSKIPRGKVLTYGQVAQALMINPRVVGYAMHGNKNTKEVPCHRVVFKDGSLTQGYAFGGKDIQKKLLLNEGVEFIEDKVNLNEFRLDLRPVV
ncbi:MAG TPA: MGMT family protein [Patescibacteria group bacterium]|nr:MGMT family protein [Patescibacteria group bacterium]